MPFAELDGARLHYDEQGDGPPVLLVHGTAACVWGGVPERLAGGHRVIQYDRRLFGDSSGPAPATGDAARDAAALLEALGATPATVVGWSMGGVVALELAIERPDLVRSLVLLEPALHMKSRPTARVLLMLLRLQVARRLRRTRRAAELFLRWALRRRSGGTTFDELSQEMREQMLGNADGILSDFDLGTGEHMKRERIGAIECPVTLLVGGSSDPGFEKAGRRLERMLPGMTVQRLPNCGHLVQFDAPDAVANAATAIDA